CSTAAAQSSVRTDTLASYSACCARAADAHAATMPSGPTTPARNRRPPATPPAPATVRTCVHHASKDAVAQPRTAPARPNRLSPVTSPAQAAVGTCVHHASKDAAACQRPTPVEPNPPSPRSDGGSSSVSSHVTATTGTTTSCATRSPSRTPKGSRPLFCSATLISPR